LQIVDRLNDARKLCPTDAAIYCVLGQVEYKLLGRAIGITHLHTAARLDPNDPTTCYLAGEVDARRGRWDAAAEYFRRAAQLDGDAFTDAADLALDELKNPDLLIKIAGDSYTFMITASNALDRRPEYKDLARATFNRGVELAERDTRRPGAPASAFATAGDLTLMQRRYDEAEKYFAAALAMDSSVVYWRLQHARALAALGRFDDAIREAETTRRMFPASKEAKDLLDSLLRPRQ
jgi:tetratricopeptide (TPR) repeat protein